MTITEKERRIEKYGKPWTVLAAALKRNAKLTSSEADCKFAKDIKKVKKQYYNKSLKVILKCAMKKKS